ncbi:zinc finger BED domain-containing protein 4-like [Phyllopteryx taeniolatus]|uniref:zinc finger BED domain-containing protein 4-like n=1 Tax=Phyllopteryx taeniolatus TaxID=161469 RepID=UPI002AD42286|nr:zinc finger BED domain-containing protein 4-like [Phyllopteryx taeniolatus]
MENRFQHPSRTLRIPENGVKDAYIERAIGICKKVVAAFSYSWKERRNLGEAQSQLHLPPHQLTAESPTRWGSCQKMTERFLEQEKAVTRVLGSDMNLAPSWQDIDVLESVNKAVKPLQDFTDALSAENYVSVSCIKPIISLLKTSLMLPEEHNTELTKTIQRNILGYLEEKYSDAVKDELLDPIFRTTYIDPDKVEQFKRRAINELLSFPTGKSPSQPIPVGQVGKEKTTPQPDPERKKPFAAFFKTSHTPPPTSQRQIKLRLN